MFENYALFSVLKTVLANPSQKLSVRETAKKSGVSASTAKNSLDFLKKLGVIKLSVVGKTYQYETVLENALTRQWKILFAVMELNNAKLVEKVLSKAKNVSNILLYGSLAKGIGDDKSDVDLLVISNSKHLHLDIDLKRELNIMFLTPFEWSLKAKSDKVFYEQVVFDSIELYGVRPVVL